MEKNSSRRIRYITTREDALEWVEQRNKRNAVKTQVVAITISIVLAFIISGFGQYGPDWLPRLF